MDKNNITETTIPSERVLRKLWRNRRRFPQSKMKPESTYKDSRGVEYLRFSNGMIKKV